MRRTKNGSRLLTLVRERRYHTNPRMMIGQLVSAVSGKAKHEMPTRSGSTQISAHLGLIAERQGVLHADDFGARGCIRRNH